MKIYIIENKSQRLYFSSLEKVKNCFEKDPWFFEHAKIEVDYLDEIKFYDYGVKVKIVKWDVVKCGVSSDFEILFSDQSKHRLEEKMLKNGAVIKETLNDRFFILGKEKYRLYPGAYEFLELPYDSN